MRQGHYQIQAGDEPLDIDRLGLRFGRQSTLHIYPIAKGAGFDPLTLAIAGIALLSTVYALTSLSNIPNVGDYGERDASEDRASYLFNGGVNTQAQGGAIPLIFGGPVRVGSTVVSAGISAERLVHTSPTPTSWRGWRGYYGTRNWRDGHHVRGAGGRRGRAPRQPVEGDNTLQTRASIRVVDLIGEGEIRGLVDGLKSVYIDETPVQNQDGSYNHDGIAFEFLPGLPDQAALSGIPAVESEHSVGREIAHGQPVTITINNNEIDSVRVTLRFPRLSHTNDQGDTGKATVRFAIAVKARGGSFSTVVNQTLTDKNISPAELSWRVDLEGEAPFQVRVSRLTPDSESDKTHNKTYFARYTEIAELRQSYPYSAVVGITAEAEKYQGAINRREYEVYGLIVNVPSNYDPDTRRYTGLWDGRFKRAWTDNGAWCFYHILTEGRFWLRRRYCPGVPGRHQVGTLSDSPVL